MVCDNQLNLNNAPKAALRPLMAGTLCVCKSELGHSLLTTSQRGGHSPTLMAFGRLKRMLGVRDTVPYHMAHMSAISYGTYECVLPSAV